MTDQHPITPPPELVQQWYKEADNQLAPYYVYIATQAARWGADQELDACATYVAACGMHLLGNSLMCARRLKPPSLKEQALAELGDVYDKGKIDDTTYDTIRRALKALPND